MTGSPPGRLHQRRARRTRWSRSTAKLLNIRMASRDQLVGNLSGGNQQKVVLARWLALRPKVLIVDEPTRGIDVGAKVEVHNLLFQMARGGHRHHRDLVRTAGSPGARPTASSPCARAASPAKSLRADADQEKLMTMMAFGSQRAA